MLANLVVVAPLLLDAAASLRERELPHRSVLTEINSVLGYVGPVLLVYVLWLGWDQRRFLLSEVQARKPGVLPELAEQELLLVAARNGAYYVVVREPSPPSPWATSCAIPFTSVEAVRVRPFTAGPT